MVQIFWVLYVFIPIPIPIIIIHREHIDMILYTCVQQYNNFH